MCPTGYYSNKELSKHFEKSHGVVYTAADIRRICGKKNCDYLEKREPGQNPRPRKVAPRNNYEKKRPEKEFNCDQCDFVSKHVISLKRHIKAMQYVPNYFFCISVT